MDKVEFGDCRETMRRWAAQGVKVQTCITSPPYFGLRDYGHDGQIGLEATPDAFVAALVEVFRCVRDVLADDGTLWLNLGDSYTGSASNGGISSKTMAGPQAATGSNMPVKRGAGLKPKDLIGIPWRVAFALQSDGWYLRQDIIWHKPNPMPESVTDRCTKSHEYIFLLSKSEKYFYDHEAIKEQAAPSSIARLNRDLEQQAGSDRVPGKTNGAVKAVGSVENRNKRSVWTVATVPYKGAHFATFPPSLIEPCVLAGSRPGDIVLDPFFGSGTTGMVAQTLGRHWLGCELNPAYGPLQDERLQQPGLMLEAA